MPWAVLESVDEETGEETMHVVPYVPCNNVFKTREECEAFVAKVDAMGTPTVTDDEDNIIGLHIGHILSPKCPCNPTRWATDDMAFNHNAAS